VVRTNNLFISSFKMKEFLIRFFKFSLIGAIPFILLIAGYFIFDPFRVIYSYSDYSNMYVIPNRDYISTEMYNKNKAKYGYNSFVFGSSRTIAFRPASWKKYLSADSHPFVFDASGESIYGIYTKIKYLDSIGCSLDNVLIIICRDVSFAYSANHIGHLFVHDPRTTGESRFKFQSTFLSAYFSTDFLVRYYAYQLRGKYSSWMNGYIEPRQITYDTVTNEIHIVDQEEAIQRDTAKYYAAHSFYIRSGERTDSVARINGKQVEMLKAISAILNRRHCNYRVVISPLYEQIKMHPSDLKILKETFGSYLFDFSGKNYFTADKHNYYEVSHYTSAVGDSILKTIY
jgi:hypothetical protein